MRSALHKKFLPPFKGTGIDPLLVGLESYWALDELSGTRFDSIGSNDLTDNNTVTYVNDGPRGVNAKFVLANSETLSRTVKMCPGDSDFTFAIWVKLTSNAVGFHFIFASYDAAFEDGPLLIQWNNGIGLQLVGHDEATHNPDLLVTDATFVYDDQWHFIVCTHDVSTKTGELFIDGVSRGTDVYPGTMDPNPTKISFGGEGGQYIDTLMGRCGIWHRLLSAPDILALYRAGQGKAYSDLGPTEKVNLVSYWNLDESSDGSGAVTRVDSEGTNDLTDNNTVCSINTGPEQVVADFSQVSNEYLNRAWVNSADMGLSIWFRLKDVSSPTGYYGLVDFSSGFYVYVVAPGGSAGTLTIMIADGANFNQVTYTIGINQWYHLVAWYDSADKKSRCILDNETAKLSTALVGARTAATAIEVGRLSTGSPSNGQIAEIGVWNSVLDASKASELFNAGVGKKYSELSAGIKTNLVSYWNLTELSGNRADSHGANTLTDNNTVMSVINMPDVADKICAKFVNASSEYFTGDPSILNLDGFTNGKAFNFWIKPTLAAVSGPFGSSADVFRSSIAVAGALTVYCYDADNNPTHYSQIDTPAGSIAANVWQMITIWYDPADKKFHVKINNGTTLNAATAMTTTPKAVTGSVAIGASNTVAGNPFDGLMDEFMIWSRIPTALEITRLFNLGKGVFYPTFL